MLCISRVAACAADITWQLRDLCLVCKILMYEALDPTRLHNTFCWIANLAECDAFSKLLLTNLRCSQVPDHMKCVKTCIATVHKPFTMVCCFAGCGDPS